MHLDDVAGISVKLPVFDQRKHLSVAMRMNTCHALVEMTTVLLYIYICIYIQLYKDR